MARRETLLIAAVVVVGYGLYIPLFTGATVLLTDQSVGEDAPEIELPARQRALVAALAAGDVLLGETGRAIAVLALGLVVVSFVPDAVIRTQLADRTGRISPGLYFVGFVGGILTLGAVGLIVGPLVVSLLLEVIDMLSEHETPADRIGEPVDLRE